MGAKGKMVVGGTSGHRYDVFMKWIVMFLYFILFLYIFTNVKTNLIAAA